MKCPECKSDLRIDHYESVEIDRCDQCEGLWLDDRELMAIVRKKEKQFSASVLADVLSSAFKGLPAAAASTQRACPRCDQLLKHVNHSYSSGIILDTCPQGHGVWLDKHELDKVQAFEEHWDVEAKRRLPELKQKLEASASAPGLADESVGVFGHLFNFLGRDLKSAKKRSG